MTTTLGLLIATALSASGQPAQAPVYADDVEVVAYESVEYPQIPLVARVQGVVVVDVSVTADGVVTDAAAISGPKLLIPAAEENARQWRIRSGVGRAILVYDFAIGDSTCADGKPLSTFTRRQPTLASIVGCSRLL